MVALKKLKAEQMESFKKEALMLQKLNHPNIVHLFGIHQSADGSMYIVTEFCSKGK